MAVQGLLAIVAVALIAVLALPFWFGMRIQSAYEEIIASASTGNPAISVETQSYERGWMNSRAVSLVRFQGAPFALKINHDIVHGPLYLGNMGSGESVLVMAVADSRLSLDGMPAGPDGASFADFKTVMRLDKSLGSVWRFSEALLPINGKPMWATLDADVAAGTAKLQFHMPELEISQPELSSRLNDLRVVMNLKGEDSGLLTGDSSISMDQLAVQAPTGEMSVEDWRMRMTTRERSGKVDFDLAFSVGGIDGPFAKAGPVSFKFQMNNLDAKTLAQLKQVQQEAESMQVEGMNEQEAMMLMMPKMMELLPALASNVDVRIPHLLVVMDNGRLGGTAALKINELDENAMAMPMMMMSAMELEADLFISEALLREKIEENMRMRLAQSFSGADGDPQGALVREDIDEQAAAETEKTLAVFASQGYIELNEGMYRTRISFQGGNLIMNGNAVNLAQMIPQ